MKTSKIELGRLVKMEGQDAPGLIVGFMDKGMFLDGFGKLDEIMIQVLDVSGKRWVPNAIVSEAKPSSPSEAWALLDGVVRLRNSLVGWQPYSAYLSKAIRRVERYLNGGPSRSRY